MSLKEQYQKFLETDFWKKIRTECFERYNWTCRHCGFTNKKRFQAHHVIYPPNAELDKTTIDMLITLCKSCHEKIHGMAKHKPNRTEKAKTDKA